VIIASWHRDTDDSNGNGGNDNKNDEGGVGGVRLRHGIDFSLESQNNLNQSG